jgi:lipid-A-disaccharide synthase
VNLIAEKEVVKELIQKELNPDNLKVELIKILDLEFRNQMIESYQEVKKKLGGVGASERAAKLMVDRL